MKRSSRKLGLNKESLYRAALARVVGGSEFPTVSGNVVICSPSFLNCSPEPRSEGTGCRPTQCW